MIKAVILAGALLATVCTAYAGQSVITDTEGSACMGDDKSRKETELTAVKDATRRAAEYAATYVQSETHVQDSALEKDLISAYSNASVHVIQELEKRWYREEGLGDCFKVKLKVEVIPDEKAATGLTKKKQALVMEGEYHASGSNPNGSTYRGLVSITRKGERYYFVWKIGATTYSGVGTLEGKVLTVDWGDKYPVIYNLQDDGRLVGTWSNGAALETLSPLR